MEESREIYKISFTGDILCDYPEYKYIKKNKCGFCSIFEEINLKEKNEILVGNLETPICDKLPYTYEPFLFNSPYAFLNEVKKCGFDILSIANNHCLDRGHIGALKTIKNIKKLQMIPVGIYLPNEKRYNVLEINGKKIAFVAYTYGTNYSHNHCLLDKNKVVVNLLKNQIFEDNKKYGKMKYYLHNIKSYLKYTSTYKTLKKIKNMVLKKNNININKAHIIDNLNDKEWKIDDYEINNLKKIIMDAKNEADNIVFLLHSGGQFNGEVGSFSKEIVKIITKLPIDIVIANHPHIVQKYEIVNDIPVFYSLGNFSFSPYSTYVNFEHKPQYSIKVNTYWYDNEIIKITFEILKMLECGENHSKVVNTFEYYNRCLDIEQKQLLEDCNFIIKRVFNEKNNNKINKLEKEYIVWEKKCLE